MPTGRIVALGGNTSLGPILRAAAAARAGLCNAQEIAQIGGQAAPEGLAGHPIDGLDPALTGLDRLVAIAAPGLGELRAALEPSGRLARRTAVYLGLPRSADGADGDAATHSRWSAELDVALGQRPALVELFPEGRAGTARALGAALEALEAERCELAVVGGVESKLDPQQLAALSAKGRLKCGEWPVGLVPGEAAVFLAVERASGAPEALARAGGGPGALVHAPTLELEPASYLAGGPAGGAALAAAIRGALESAGKADASGTAWLDLNGETYRSTDWGMALVRARRTTSSDQFAIELPALCFGDVGAAFPTLAIALAARSFQRGYAKGEVALVCACGDAGERGAVVVRPDR